MKFLILFLVCFIPFAFSQEKNDLQVLIVSAEDSSVASEKKLDYASMDAQRLVRALTVAGKVDAQNITSLKNPSMEEFDNAVSVISKKKIQKFMFYFSGHSNENGLHLRDGSITKTNHSH
mgnify:CR=1 FL=1